MIDFNGAPERIRTSDPQIRSLVLYPAELRARNEPREVPKTRLQINVSFHDVLTSQSRKELQACRYISLCVIFCRPWTPP